MIILEQRKNKNSPNPYGYISGIFIDTDTYIDYMNEYPKLLRTDLKEVHINTPFPLFIIE